MSGESKAAVTPGIKESEQEGDEDELSQEEATKYRALTARANYLAQDRSDIGYATKELTRKMSKPRAGDMRKLKRLARYLIGKERMITRIKRQGHSDRIDAWVDTDYAGCKETRKSTSGGMISVGMHTIKAWSNTQAVIALSSGEAEYYGMVRGASIALGIRSLMEDMGVKTRVRIMTDSSAALGISKRRGLGKVRHLELNQLWLQDKVSTGDIDIRKVKGTENMADALTKHVDQTQLRWHIQASGQEVTGDRHQLAPRCEA